VSARGLAETALFFVVLLALVRPLGDYMARVYSGEAALARRALGPLERLSYRAMGVKEDAEGSWQAYARDMLVFNTLGLVLVYALLRAQAVLPENPQHLPAVSPEIAFDTATSFATNTNWQSYSGEATLSYLSQMLGLGVQNFVSAASGMAVLVAVIRGFSRKSAQTLGSFWVDLVRSTLYVLLPLALVFAVFLVSQGVVQTFAPYAEVTLLAPTHDAQGAEVKTTLVALGPAASQIAIKDLGTNGGGFFNANSAHPFENPTPLSNFAITLSILLVPAALTRTFGKMVGDVRQGWALLAVMLLVFVPFVALCGWAESADPPSLASLGVALGGGNLEGKEVRFGIPATTLYATATTAASNGSVNAMHDSFSPLGGLAPLVLMQLGEVIFGGVGSGMYGMLAFAIVAVFVAGLMVGRTPEYLGKKIEVREMKMASLVVIVPAAAVLVGTAIAVATQAGQKGISAPGPHGFTQALYAFSSAGNNNGSAFGGLDATSPFWATSLAIAMWLGRFWVKVPMLALAGHLAAKKKVPQSSGTLPTHGPLFVVMLTGVVIIVGALTFIPALALGPIVEHLLQRGG